MTSVLDHEQAYPFRSAASLAPIVAVFWLAYSFTQGSDSSADPLGLAYQCPDQPAGSDHRFSVRACYVHSLEAAEDTLVGVQGWGLGERKYWCPELKEKRLSQRLFRLMPYKSAKRDKQSWPYWGSRKRNLVDTVLSQLAERYQATRVWTGDA